MINEIASNHLIYEKSPYLLQHAHNPVNWYAWSDEAFEKAKKEDKLIFLSIGYSTCHWCHVMAHECFEDITVANFLNENFISIKVDREERPDIDSVYMSVCQALTGSGGWPLSVFIDYEKNPIYAGTYFPKNTFLDLLEQLTKLWVYDRNKLNENSQNIINYITKEKTKPGEVDIDVAEEAFHLLESNFDDRYGGFSSAPKFPTPHNLIFLLKYYLCTKNPKGLDMCLKTLDSMRAGGIFDHIGFGFSRYSTDRKWLVPHFEKMLYDNSLLIVAYVECYRILRENKYLKTAEEIADYLMRKMQDLEGGFYTAEDADSEGVEGKFYVFSKEEINKILEEDADKFCNLFNITERGNFEGENIPNLIGQEIKLEDKEFIENCRLKLFNYQNKREHPHKDDKILTSYNGLAITAFSILGRISKNKKYIEVAKRVSDFIQEKLFVKGKLMARFRDGEVKYLGYDDDYSYMIMGLISLYESTLNRKYLDFANELNKIFINNFYDDKNGGFYKSDKDSEKILVRKKEIYDGATPSANSVEVYNLYRLSSLTDNDEYLDIAEKTMNYFANEIKEYPAAYSFSAMNILYQTYGSVDIALVANKKEDLEDMLKIIEDCELPFLNIIYDENKELKMENNKPTAYVCKGYICLPPITNLENLSEVLRK